MWSKFKSRWGYRVKNILTCVNLHDIFISVVLSSKAIK
ncbi:UNVERIFIED_ORG: hypothetical protein QQG_6834 [Clostridioides difficile Y384]